MFKVWYLTIAFSVGRQKNFLQRCLYNSDLSSYKAINTTMSKYVDIPEVGSGYKYLFIL